MNSATSGDEAGPAPKPAVLKVGDFEIHADSNEIRSADGTVRLRPLIMQVLLRLASTPAAAVTRDQLINDVWSRRIVNDEVLSRAIAELRTALGDDSREPRYIETLPKVGYRLVAAVGRLAELAPAPATGMLSGMPAETLPPAPTTLASSPVTATRPPWRPFILGLLGLALICVPIFLWWSPTPAPAGDILLQQINAAAPFASDPAPEIAPRFSADGRQVIYLRRFVDRNELLVHDLHSGKRNVVASAPEIISSPVFFPDGERIAYWRRSADGCEIVEQRLADKSRRRLLDCRLNPAARFDLSPDGQRLVFSARAVKEYPNRLMLLDIAGGKLTTLTQPTPGEGDDIYPRFSPDGARIAFFRGNESHQRAWLVNATPPHAAKAATTIEGQSYGLAWMGVNGPLLVAADWHGFRALNRLDINSGDTRLLGARGARFPDVSREAHLVYENAVYRADLWLTDTAEPGKRKQVLWPSTRYSNQPQFSPDGKRIVFSSNREGTDSIFVGTLGGDARRLALPEGYRHIRPHWSPDGRSILAVRIAAAGSRPTEQHAIRVDVDSGRLEVLAQAGNRVNSIHALANGDLLVGEITDYAMRLVRITAKGEKQRLALPLVSEYGVNGNTLVYTLPQLSGVTRCELDSLRCTPLKVALDDRVRFDWTVARDAIWYLGENPRVLGKRALLRYDFASGRIDSYDFAPSGAGSSLAASPDGTQLIVLQEEQPVLDLMLALNPGK